MTSIVISGGRRASVGWCRGSAPFKPISRAQTRFQRKEGKQEKQASKSSIPKARGWRATREIRGKGRRGEGDPTPWGSPTISRRASPRSRNSGKRMTAIGWSSSVSWSARLNRKYHGFVARQSWAQTPGPTSGCRASGRTSSWWSWSSTTLSRPTLACTKSRRGTKWARLRLRLTWISAVSSQKSFDATYFFPIVGLRHIAQRCYALL